MPVQTQSGGHKTRRISDKNLGIIYIIGAALGFALMNLFVQLSGDVPVLQKCFFRNIVALFLVLPAALIEKRKPAGSGTGCQTSKYIFHNISIGKGNFKYLFLRSLFGTLGLILNFYAIDHLDSISDASMLNKLSPFFALIFSILILKEIPKWFDCAALVVAFIGALFVIKPDMSLGGIPAVIGTASGLFAGLAYTYVRKLGMRGEKSATIIVFFSAFSGIVLLPFIVFDYHHMNMLQLIYLISAGASAAMGQIFITNAYKVCPAKEISFFDYTQVIFAAVLGFIFLGQLADVYSFIGYFIIISVAVFRWYMTNY